MTCLDYKITGGLVFCSISTCSTEILNQIVHAKKSKDVTQSSIIWCSWSHCWF